MTILRLLIAVILLTTTASLAAEVKPAAPAARDKCPVCGMFVAKYPDFLAEIVFKDGSHAFFDGVKDMMKYYFDLPKYNPAKSTADIGAIFVNDYYSLSPTDGLKAYFVFGSNVYGPMGKELIPFKEEAEAKDFVKDHAGQSIYKFNDINIHLIKTLD
ncbi:MAG: nitrous oxide reductase accessory protein NosL [Desulfobaccales bacterium]